MPRSIVTMAAGAISGPARPPRPLPGARARRVCCCAGGYVVAALETGWERRWRRRGVLHRCGDRVVEETLTNDAILHLGSGAASRLGVSGVRDRLRAGRGARHGRAGQRARRGLRAGPGRPVQHQADLRPRRPGDPGQGGRAGGATSVDSRGSGCWRARRSRWCTRCSAVASVVAVVALAGVAGTVVVGLLGTDQQNGTVVPRPRGTASLPWTPVHRPFGGTANAAGCPGRGVIGFVLTPPDPHLDLLRDLRDARLRSRIRIEHEHVDAVAIATR